MVSPAAAGDVLDPLCRLDLRGGQPERNPAGGLAGAETQPALSSTLIVDDQDVAQAC